MDELTLCPVCHNNVRLTDYFCYNCGKNLQSKPTSLSLPNMILYIVGSIVLPPMGAIWGIRFFQKGNSNAKKYGIFLIVLTLIELILITKYTIDLTKMINNQVNSRLQNIQGF